MILPETDFQCRQGDFILLKACRRASPCSPPAECPQHALMPCEQLRSREIDTSEMPECIAQMTPAAQPPATEK